jgi:hypothetical protein
MLVHPVSSDVDGRDSSPGDGQRRGWPPGAPPVRDDAQMRRVPPPGAPRVRLALHDCKYALLRLAARRLGWQAVEEEGEGDYFEWAAGLSPRRLGTPVGSGADDNRPGGGALTSLTV